MPWFHPRDCVYSDLLLGFVVCVWFEWILWVHTFFISFGVCIDLFLVLSCLDELLVHRFTFGAVEFLICVVKSVILGVILTSELMFPSRELAGSY